MFVKFRKYYNANAETNRGYVIDDACLGKTASIDYEYLGQCNLLPVSFHKLDFLQGRKYY